MPDERLLKAVRIEERALLETYRNRKRLSTESAGTSNEHANEPNNADRCQNSLLRFKLLYGERSLLWKRTIGSSRPKKPQGRESIRNAVL